MLVRARHCTALVLILAVAPMAARGASAQVRTASADPPAERFRTTSTVTLDGVRATVVVDHFVLSGPTYRAVRRRLEGEGPLGESGRANAITDYEMRPRLRMSSDGRRCHTEDVVVEVDIRILLPEWKGRDRAPTRERERWDAFRKDLVDHEYAHRDATLSAVQEVRDELEALSAGRCTRLVLKVDRVMDRAQAALNARHAAVDRGFSHGVPSR